MHSRAIGVAEGVAFVHGEARAVRDQPWHDAATRGASIGRGFSHHTRLASLDGRRKGVKLLCYNRKFVDRATT